MVSPPDPSARECNIPPHRRWNKHAPADLTSQVVLGAVGRLEAEVVLTDFDGVVRHWPAAVAASVEDRYGLKRGSLARTAFDPSILDDAITGRLTDSEWRNEIARRLGAETDADTGRSAVAAWSTGRGIVDQAALRVLQAARSAAALGLVTNATTRLDDDLAWLGLTDAFDFVVNSSAVGFAKPSRCFYEHAARRCGCDSGAVLFVDDRTENVDAAIDFDSAATCTETRERSNGCCCMEPDPRAPRCRRPGRNDRFGWTLSLSRSIPLLGRRHLSCPGRQIRRVRQLVPAPVLDGQTFYRSEIAKVARDKNRIVRHRNGPYAEVHTAQARPRSAQPFISARGCFAER